MDTKDGNGTEQDGKETKIEFNEQQQTFINDLINKRFSKETAKHNEVLKTKDEQITALSQQLEELKNGKGTKKEGDSKDEKEKQFADLLNNEKSQTKAAKDALQKEQDEKKVLASENLRIRKEVAMRQAAGGRFLDMEVLMAMTSGNVEWDDDTKNFVIRENGIVRQNSSLQNMTLEEYFEEFGKKRPYLVNSDVVGGAGSTENKKNGQSTVGVVNAKADLKTTKDKVAYISKFGLDAYEKLPLR